MSNLLIISFYNFPKFCQILKAIEIRKEFLFELGSISSFQPNCLALAFGRPTPLLGRLFCPGLAASLPPHWALSSGWPSPPPPSPLTAAWAPPSFLLPRDKAECRRHRLYRARASPASPPLLESTPHSPPLHFPLTPSVSPPRSTTLLPLRPYKRVPRHPLSSPLLPCPSFPSLHALSKPTPSAPPPPPLAQLRHRSTTSRAPMSPMPHSPSPVVAVEHR
jgi:hypothetical protein